MEFKSQWLLLLSIMAHVFSINEIKKILSWLLSLSGIRCIYFSDDIWMRNDENPRGMKKNVWILIKKEEKKNEN